MSEKTTDLQSFKCRVDDFLRRQPPHSRAGWFFLPAGWRAPVDKKHKWFLEVETCSKLWQWTSFLTIINEKSTFPHNLSFFTQTCDSCLICFCVMLASLRKGSPFIHRNRIAANQVQPLCRIDHISWPSLQASSYFPDISHPTSFQHLLFSGCLLHRKKQWNPK